MSLTLLSWRRTVAGLYADVRAADDPRAGWQRWRTGRDVLLAEHPDSPLSGAAREHFTGLPVSSYDPALRFTSALDTDVEQQRLKVPTAADGVVPFVRIGRVTLGEVGRLDVWWLDTYGGGIFVPVRDGSAGTTTYGGGRYLLDTVKGADLGGTGRELVLDLNFAYHPSCAYDPRWSCPLAPEGNRLSEPVRAGEQLPPGGWY